MTKILQEPDQLDPRVRAFHEQRRMFWIVGGEVRLAPEGAWYGHRQWAEWLMDEEGRRSDESSRRWRAESLMEHNTRGFFDATGVYAYRGEDFKGGLEVERDVTRRLDELGVADRLPVYVGMQPGAPGERWEPLKRMGTVAELRAFRSRVDVGCLPIDSDMLERMTKALGSHEAVVLFVRRALAPVASGIVTDLFQKECRHAYGESLACEQSNTLHECARCGRRVWD